MWSGCVLCFCAPPHPPSLSLSPSLCRCSFLNHAKEQSGTSPIFHCFLRCIQYIVCRVSHLTRCRQEELLGTCEWFYVSCLWALYRESEPPDARRGGAQRWCICSLVPKTRYYYKLQSVIYSVRCQLEWTISSVEVKGKFIICVGDFDSV